MTKQWSLCSIHTKMTTLHRSGFVYCTLTVNILNRIISLTLNTSLYAGIPTPLCVFFKFIQCYIQLSTISVFSAYFCTSAPDFYTRNLPIHRSKLSSSVCWLGFKWSFPEPISVNSYAKQAPLIGMKAVLKSFSLTIYMHFCSAQDNLLFRMYVN